MSRSKQKKYLKDYPQSSHRFLFEEEEAKRKEAKSNKGAEAPAEKSNVIDIKTGKPKEEPKEEVKPRTFSKHLTKAQFAALDDEGKALYLSQFQSSSHKERPPRSKARPSRSEFDFTSDDHDSEFAELQKELESMNEGRKGSINSETIGALNDVSTDDLKEGAEDLKNNAEDVAEDVSKRFANQPKLLARGLSSIRKLWGGGEGGEPQELSPKEKRHASDTMSQITKYALLGLGIAALAVAASPAAFIIAHAMMDTYGRGIMDKKDRTKDNKIEDLEKENSTMKAAEKDRAAQIKARQKAIIEERKLKEKEERERQEEIAKKQEELSDNTEENEKPEDADTEDADTEESADELDVEESEDGVMKVAASDTVVHTHEDDHNTLVEIIKHIGEFMDTTTSDDLRNHARVAFGKRANHLVSHSSTYSSITELAAAVDGKIDGNFVVTASARLEYNESTGRYGYAAD